MVRIVSVADFLDPGQGFDPTPAEQELIDAWRAGQPCTLGDGTLPEAESPGRRVRADLLRLLILGGTPGCGLHVAGVALVGAWVAGELDLRAASARGQTVLVLCRFEERPLIAQARLEHLDLAGSKLPGLFAPGARIGGALVLRGATVTGTVDVSAAEIGGQLDCDGATMTAGEGGALFGQGMKLGQGLYLRKAKVTGTVAVNGAKIGGQFTLAEATLTAGMGRALDAQGLSLGHSLVLSKACITGTVNVAGAETGGQLDCTEASLTGGREASLIGGTEERQTEGRCTAFIGQGLRVKHQLIFKKLVRVQGLVSLGSARVGDLVDDTDSWAKATGPVWLDGFTYDRIVGATTDARERLGWLARAAGGGGAFYPQPYTRLAKVLAAMGHARGPREVLLEHERLFARHGRRRAGAWPSGESRRRVWPRLRAVLQRGLNVPRAAWDTLVRGVVGYGYFPTRSVIVLFALWLLATTLAHMAWVSGGFAPASDVILTSEGWQAIRAGAGNAAALWSAPGAPGQDWETFSRYAWAADLLVPLVDLGQTAAWAPTTAQGKWGWWLWWARWPLVVAGWVVVALVAAAVTGILQKDRD
ncbi:MAG: hypothetical protein KJZ85_06720 [Rhodobacteraceae bacterium]|jgi:hypothetical protein|nr:hypothetical protein [Paracoccaceae bacterium]